MDTQIDSSTSSLVSLLQSLKDASYVKNYQEMVRAMPENHRRWHAAMLVEQFDGKGITLVARLTGLSRPTVYAGMNDLANGRVDFTRTRQRPEHAGRPKTIEERCPGIADDLKQIIRFEVGGDPMKGNDQCVRMSSRKIQKLLKKRGHKISHVSVIQLLKKTKSRS